MINVDFEQGNQNKLYEDALLGFILTDPDKMLEVSEILPSAEYFKDPTNRAAYNIFLTLFNNDNFPGDPALTIKELYTGAGGKQHFETMDQAARYVNSLLNAPIDTAKFNAASFREYAEQIKWEKDRSDIRNIAVETLAEVDRVPYDERENFIGGIESKLGEVTMAVHGKEGLKHISEMTSEISEQIETLRGGSPLAAGVPTGIPSLDKTLNGLKGGEVCVLAARPAMGKSLPRLTLIPTPEGFKKLEDIRVGDFVFDQKGQPTKVLGVFPQEEKLDVYEIEMVDGRKIKCSGDHIWTYWQNTRHNNKHAVVLNTITTKEMYDKGTKIIKPSEIGTNRKNRHRWAIPNIEPVQYPERKYKIPPYIMGLLLGDGCKNNNGNIQVSSKYPEHMAKVAEILGAADYRKDKDTYTWSFYKEPYHPNARRLDVQNLNPEYSELLAYIFCGEKYIPEEYLLGSIDQRVELLQGLMDSDGTLCKQHNRTTICSQFSTSSRRLANDIRMLLFSLGYQNSLSITDRIGQEHLGPNGKIYEYKSLDLTVTINCQNKDKLNLATLTQKRANVEAVSEHQTRRHYERLYIHEIRKLGYKDDMICLYVDNPDHMFLCGDYIPTHNTTLSMQIAYNIATLKPETPKDPQHAVLIFSLEMMEAQLVSRMISTISRVNMQQFMDEYQHYVSDNGQFYANTYGEKFQELMERKLTQQYERTQIALKEIQDLPIYPTTESGLSPNAIKSMVMQKKRELERKNQKLSLIVIDYLQLMVPNLGKANASRTEEVGDMSRKMKLLAKEFDVPVLLLAQLNRNADVTERPNLKDLRESGSIEQDADKVMFIWSEHADKTINDFSEYRDDIAKREALRREQQKVLISVAKNRQGETGDCRVIFDKGFQTFVSQNDEHVSNGETFEEFALLYYQKTRTEDLFWPIKPGDVSEELEAYRKLPIMEQPYLDNNGNVITMSNADQKRGSMGIQSTVSRPSGGSEMSEMFDGSVGAANAVAAASESKPDLDRIKPSQPPIVEDDLATDFEEIGDEEQTDVDTAEALAMLDDVTMDDDEPLDLDDFSTLNSLTEELSAE